jgi:hypothetical protein
MGKREDVMATSSARKPKKPPANQSSAFEGPSDPSVFPTEQGTDAIAEPHPELTPEPGDPRDADGQPLPDGGVAQHPVHDEDQEDLQSEDFEEEIDEIEAHGLTPDEEDLAKRNRRER